jgi:hypothetical protein
MAKWKMSGERNMKMETCWMEMGRDNGTVNDTSGCDGRSSNRMRDDGDTVISAIGVAGIGSE